MTAAASASQSAAASIVGRKKTGGRKKGTPNKSTHRLPWLLREAAEAELSPAVDGDDSLPLDALLEIMRDPLNACQTEIVSSYRGCAFLPSQAEVG